LKCWGSTFLDFIGEVSHSQNEIDLTYNFWRLNSEFWSIGLDLNWAREGDFTCRKFLNGGELMMSVLLLNSYDLSDDWWVYNQIFLELFPPFIQLWLGRELEETLSGEIGKVGVGKFEGAVEVVEFTISFVES
jgi:hypothetical protein